MLRVGELPAPGGPGASSSTTEERDEAVLRRLEEGPAGVPELASVIKDDQRAVHACLRRLRRAGLVEVKYVKTQRKHGWGNGRVRTKMGMWQLTSEVER